MKKVLITAIAVVLGGCLGLPVLLSGAVGGGTACSARIAPGPDGYDDEQLHMASTIVDVGVARGVPRWGWVVAIATALQESGLRNLPHLDDDNDHDSIGVFQQRPSQGWGTPAQLADPAYQAAGFYVRLLRVPGWQRMPLTKAAQVVQRSAYPDAYGRWTDEALELVNSVTTTLRSCASVTPTPLPDGFTLPPATPTPVVVAISWALGQVGTPYSFGGSCTEPHAGNPDTQCDCSSLVQQAYHAAGITLPRVTTDQVRVGIQVPSAHLLKPGDLIFIPGALGNLHSPRHVGMYLGDRLIVQAPRSGDVVMVSSLDSWLPDVVAIRRMVV